MRAAVIAVAHSSAVAEEKWRVRPLWLWLGVSMVCYGVLARVLELAARPEDWWIHGAWCVGGLLFTVPIILRCVRDGIAQLLTDHLVMFTSAFSLYFLFGASFMAFGPDEKIALSLQYYYVDALIGLRIDAINAIGFGISLIVAATCSRRWFHTTAERSSRVLARAPVVPVLAFYVLLGISAFLYASLHDYAAIDGVVPGVIRSMGQFTVVAVFLAASYRGQFRLFFNAVAVALSVVMMLAGLLMFNKTQVLVALGALVLGLARGKSGRRILPMGVLLCALVYVGISGMASYGRNTLGDLIVPLSQRWDVVLEGLGADTAGDPLADSNPWARLSYISAQGAGLHFYESGIGGDEFALIPWAFVPRVLFPEKPIITEPSAIFHEKISGNKLSSTGQGVFSGGYYSGGWPGVVAAAAIAGWILAQTSAIAAAVVRNRALLMLPLALYGVYIAFRIDGSFLSDYVGAFAFVVYPMLGLRAMCILVPASRQVSPQVSER